MNRPMNAMDAILSDPQIRESLKSSCAPDLDLETCSWCTTEVPDSTLVVAHDGARVCRECIQQHLRDVNLPCAGCGQKWHGPKRDCMDHLDDCTYAALED